MSHSLIPNAGQQYASARKQGVEGNELKGLRIAMTKQLKCLAGNESE